MARRSPLDGEWKAHRTRRVSLTQHKIGTNNNVQGPASGTRSSKKRKLNELAPIQGGGEPELEDHEANIDLWSNEPSKPRIPEKRVLELILDTLQRRDTHEIFAEPVDPNEVEEYYEIIKEPMDFGTMRAKLHEGMYGSLEQFERDIFLITKNAMHFNSSNSIFFREARVIDELAAEVFRVLKTHPESFEREFSEPRLRSARRSLGEAGNSLHGTRPKLARNAKSNSGTINESLKSMPSSSNTFSNIRRRTTFRRGVSGPSSCSDENDREAPFWGVSDDKGSRFIESDKRHTYNPWMSCLDGNDPITLFMYPDRKQLEHVIQKDICYSKSLMLFVKDLGPVVQKIARQKLYGHNFLVQNCSASTDHSRDRPIAAAAPTSQTFTDHATEKGKRTHIEGKMVKNMVPSAGFGDQVFQDRSSAVLLASSLLARAGDLDRPLELDFWRIRSDSLGLLREDDRVKSESGQESKSRFAFEFPFSKSGLGQTNAFRRLAYLQRSSGAELNFFNV